MEKITIKFNLKLFVEELLFAYMSSDEDLVKELDIKFRKFMCHQTEDIRHKTLKYLQSYKIVQENEDLDKYFGDFLCQI